ncbi:(Glutamate--ammonia-ligase) adenylyltransferase [Thioalkalivibrio sulfidiphilus HL-EbGr7]|uniref:Bifunctional glutamine synthetase adenylyltransferase/adenylyl-removing enzyme n=1 Tax=Thioalkalivibrio sulfidiphilus (strain HL-EbGR7) TaxID=396588 RepID=GLNE_THISH|nr:bifunctional [glutamate--ammonia ligase]-adenylyl-L-tyrosine phosphorylase/[glutamate--ammonia-ligase] adenylyltransferase [Thioalkalivibrio sulfidiphilus]B8GL43.1 RecName: Full=Bifunctional glutamine synthetase adenylyltransferase/adenylyl-removing enzyme; AltName: Full=ATP:glutamine synthetase adenylyltransferase; AltName: Full=ATase; Includes: RecName: Full=Glutamine synthetase adenylyl-L-tyrosine phosphorylase; AltName: Full=Adenylyl removase; Short=AR; Short=AT-N; Includes: RecName: Full=G
MNSLPPRPSLDVLPEALRPDLIRLLDDFESACARDGIALDHWPEALVRVWAGSGFAARIAIRRPNLLLELIQDGTLARPLEAGEMAARVSAVVQAAQDEAALMRDLRLLRQREMMRIAWRDLSGEAGLDETLGDLTDLAEHCIDQAAAWVHGQLVQRHGEPRDAEGRPQRLVVLGMGKLGGRELNFSSDVDLIFTYAARGETDGEKPLDNQQFFIRLGQRLIRLLDENTAEGFVFRVDMRLRPFGDAGPLVMDFDTLEGYYESHGREWERYALIKARVVAGDREAGRELMRALRPFVFRRYLDYGAFAALRDMKAMINREAARRSRGDDVKLGEGGIREVEFIGQAFQLIRAGRDPRLQLRGIRPVLRRLAEMELMPGYVVDQLITAYEFLRRTENHLQMAQDQQTHRLPESDEARLRLAFSMGHDDWEGFSRELARHRRRVQEHFQQVFAAPQGEAEEAAGAEGPGQAVLASIWAGDRSGERAQAVLAEAGFRDAPKALEWIEDLREGAACRSLTATGRERLDQLMPLLLGAAAGAEDPDTVLSRLVTLVRSIARRSVYLSLLVESPMALSQLVKLCDASPWIAQLLTRHPLLLDELLDPRSLYAPMDREGLSAELDEELSQVPEDDMEQMMDRLRQFQQVQMLKVAAADIMGVLPLMKVSDHLTWIAEVVLERVLSLVMAQLHARYGRPRCLIDGRPYEPGFAIIGYGKLGGLELGYGSDLDIVFLHDSAGEQQMTDGDKALDNSEFFARLGQRIVHVLGTYTGAGRLYEVDTRLRPSGASGLLVSSLKAFELYQETKAWTWEHQALVRARPVAGDAHIAEGFAEIRRRVLGICRDREKLRQEVREMREKMWSEHASRDPSRFNLKRDPGGIADIEFMVQYWVLAYACDHPPLLDYPDNIRILERLVVTGVLPEEDARFLTDTYREFRNRIHRLTLQESDAVVDAAEFAEQRETVRALWRRVMEEGKA